MCLCRTSVVLCGAIIIRPVCTSNVVRESIIGTFGVGACVVTNVAGISAFIVLVMFCTSM